MIIIKDKCQFSVWFLTFEIVCTNMRRFSIAKLKMIENQFH